jgi:hypothetical protein
MNALRLAAASIAAAALLVAAVLGCGNNTITLTECAVPTLDEKAADGGPDPCHCDPPPSLNITSCNCLSDPNDPQSIDNYNVCILLYRQEQDAGGDGGP